MQPRNWQDFEFLARDLFAEILGDPFVDLNGRSGQPQAGVDVWGVDQKTGKSVGAQCKGRADAHWAPNSRLSADEFRAEVARAKAFVPPLDTFVMLTTGPNDAELKQLARELSDANQAEGLFSVKYHGWDWVEGLLARNTDLAASYGLAALVRGAPDSAIGMEIGRRLAQALELINAKRHSDDRITLQRLARLARHGNWRRLEQIVQGRAETDETELEGLAGLLAISPLWLIEGKGAPFCVDPDGFRTQVEEIHAAITALAPERIFFVRQRDESDYAHCALIALQLDDLRWHVLRNTYPVCEKVGAGGRHDMLELCRLIRHLDHADVDERFYLFGSHLDSSDFQRLLDGEVYPGAVLDLFYNDRWWEGFATLRLDWCGGDAPHWVSLRNAVVTIEYQLARVRTNAQSSASWRKALTWGKFRLKAPAHREEGEPWP